MRGNERFRFTLGRIILGFNWDSNVSVRPSGNVFAYLCTSFGRDTDDVL